METGSTFTATNNRFEPTRSKQPVAQTTLDFSDIGIEGS